MELLVRNKQNNKVCRKKQGTDKNAVTQRLDYRHSIIGNEGRFDPASRHIGVGAGFEHIIAAEFLRVNNVCLYAFIYASSV